MFSTEWLMCAAAGGHLERPCGASLWSVLLKSLMFGLMVEMDSVSLDCNFQPVCRCMDGEELQILHGVWWVECGLPAGHHQEVTESGFELGVAWFTYGRRIL